MLRSYYNKFNRGEIDEKAMARDDIERIKDSAALMENWVPQRLGPMQYRPGTEFLGAVEPNLSHYIIPYLSKGNENALLEFSASDANPSVTTLRIWIDDALMTRTGTSDAITNPGFTSDITGWTDESDAGGTSVWTADGGGSLALNGDEIADWGRAYQTQTLTAGERTLDVWVSEAPVYLSIGTAGTQSNDVFGDWLNPGFHSFTFTATAVAHTYTFQNDKAYRGLVQSCDYASAGTFSLTGDFWFDTSTLAQVLPTVRYTQAGDTMFITSNGYELEGHARPYVMFQRRGTTSWSFVLPNSIDGPFGLVNDTGLTLTPGATSGNTTLTSSKAYFKSTSVGDIYELVHGAVVGRCKIMSYINSTTVNVRITAAMGGATATTEWYHGVFGDYLPGPTATEMFEGRMWLAGEGQIHGSVSDAYTSFDRRLEGAQAAIQRTIGFGTVQEVSWLLGGDRLIMGLTSEELKIGSNDFGDALTPVNVKISRGTSRGSAPIRPLVIDKIIYFVQRSLKKVIAATGLSKEIVETEDITLLHPDVCDPGIKRLAYVAEPEPRIYALLTDGTLRVFLFDKAEDIRGWSRIVLGGGGTVVDIASIPTDDQDAVYMVVERDGTRSLEKLAKFSEAIGQSDSRHYDSHKVYTSPGTTITGLDHLEGLTVNVWGDGIDRETQTVAGGVITVTNSWTDVVVGLRHKAKYLSNRLSDYIRGSVLSDSKRVVRMAPIMKNAALRTIKYGPDENTLDNMPQIAEGKALAPTTEPEIQIVDLIAGATAGEITAKSISIQGDHAYCACLGVPSAPETWRDQFMAYYNGSVYQPGGLTTGNAGSKETWKFNLTTLAAVQLADTPVTAAEHGVCEHGGIIYSTAASGGVYWMAYNIATEVWLTVAQPDPIIAHHNAIAAYNGKVYVYGGAIAGVAQAYWAIYDIAGDSWDFTAFSGTIEAKYQHCMTAPQSGTGAGKIYISGGLTGSVTDTKNFYEYNISTNTMTALSSTGMVAKQHAKIDAADDGFLYNFGGKPRVGTTNYDKGMYRYSISGNSWSNIHTLTDEGNTEPWARTSFGMAYDTVNDRIYIFGGRNFNANDQGSPGGLDFIPDMWYFDVGLTEWVSVVSSWASGGGALRIVNILDVEDLVDTGTLNVTSADQNLRGHAIVTNSFYAFISTVEENSDNRGIVAIDIAAPSAVMQLGYLEGGANTSTVGRAMALDGDVVYLQSFATNGSLASIDVSDPTTPVLLDELVLPFGSNAVNSEKMVQIGLYLYIPWENDLHIVDVSNPSALVLVSTYNFTSMTAVNTVVMESSEFIWAIDTAGILTGISLANPIIPIEIGALTDATNLSSIEDAIVFTPYLYAIQATKGQVFDITDPTTPVLFTTYTGFVGLKSMTSNTPNHMFAGSTLDAGIFYSADQRSNAYVDYDEPPFEFEGGYDPDSRLYFQSEGPATVLAIVYDVEDSDIETDDTPEDKKSGRAV